MINEAIFGRQYGDTIEEAIEQAEYQVEIERLDYIDDLLGTISTIDLRTQSVIETLGYDNHSNEANWLNDNSNIQEVNDIFDFLEENNLSTKAIDWAKVQIKLETLSDKIKLKYKPGKIKNRDYLKYTHIGTNGVYTVYQLEDGSRVMFSPHSLDLNEDGKLVSTLASFSGEFYYLKIKGSNEWSNFIILLAEGLEAMFILGSKLTATAFARYVLPIEDVMVIFSGRDLDGNEASRLQAGGFLLLAIVPGSKALKFVKFIPKNALKWGKAIITASGKSMVLKSEIINGLVTFGNRNQLKYVIGSAGTGKHAHHIIPWAKSVLDLVQKAAKANKRFHLNERLNGIALATTNHLKGHATYSAKVQEVLIFLHNRNTNMNANQAYAELTMFISYLDNLIKNNPNKNLGQIADLIKYP